jgi:hypothetical protein
LLDLGARRPNFSAISRAPPRASRRFPLPYARRHLLADSIQNPAQEAQTIHHHCAKHRRQNRHFRRWQPCHVPIDHQAHSDFTQHTQHVNIAYHDRVAGRADLAAAPVDPPLDVRATHDHFADDGDAPRRDCVLQRWRRRQVALARARRVSGGKVAPAETSRSLPPSSRSASASFSDSSALRNGRYRTSLWCAIIAHTTHRRIPRSGTEASASREACVPARMGIARNSGEFNATCSQPGRSPLVARQAGKIAGTGEIFAWLCTGL